MGSSCPRRRASRLTPVWVPACTGTTILKSPITASEHWFDANQQYGLQFNPNGQVPPLPSLDVIIGGNVVSWFDANGVH
ncbi:MAG: hypothetical protein FJY67_09350 [Calditrichaeota bacterium]|nr:hypothetical protein [Calditrichota bacterium]